MPKFSEVAAVRDDSGMGHAIRRSDTVRKRVFSDVPVMAHINVRSTELGTESTPGALLPRPVLYVSGTIRSIDLNDEVASAAECPRVVVSSDKSTDEGGIEARFRYEFTDMQVARIMVHGACDADFPRMNPALIGSDNEIPVRADITVAYPDDTDVPIVTVGVRDPFSIVTNRRESGYDYVRYMGVSREAAASYGPEFLQALENELRGRDRGAIAMAATARVDEPAEEQTAPAITQHERTTFESLFDDIEDMIAEEDAKMSEAQLVEDEQIEQAETETERTADTHIEDDASQRVRNTPTIDEIIAESDAMASNYDQSAKAVDDAVLDIEFGDAEGDAPTYEPHEGDAGLPDVFESLGYSAEDVAQMGDADLDGDEEERLEEGAEAAALASLDLDELDMADERVSRANRDVRHNQMAHEHREAVAAVDNPEFNKQCVAGASEADFEAMFE